MSRSLPFPRATTKREKEAVEPGASVLRTLARFGLGAMLLLTGTGHLSFWRRESTAQVPESLPFSKDFVVVSSGFVELALAAALLAVPPRRRVPMGLAMAAFFVAVFPGNISQYQTGRSSFGLDTDNKRFARLFFQPVLVAWALWSTGAERGVMRRTSGQSQVTYATWRERAGWRGRSETPHEPSSTSRRRRTP